jgi:uncharacterized protein (DUF1501 family)
MQEQLSRREMLRLSSAGLLAGSVSGWFDTFAAQAAETAAQGAKHKSCILLWMNGGPAQSHTFDLKDGSEFKPIDTTVSGIKVSEYLPNLAKQMEHCAVLRSMSTGEGSHDRARYLMHTGYRQGFGGTTYPSMGSFVAESVGDPEFELPNFVAIGGGTLGAGYLGPKFSPLVVGDPSRGVENLKPYAELDELDQRAKLLDEFNQGLFDKYQQTPIEAQQKGYQKAMALMHSPKAKAFNIDQEPSSIKSKYGSGRFAQGCLLARRLVEVGVSFVEVSLGGWDTHQGAATPVKGLSGQIDAPWAALLSDLKERGLLDSTLVIWMGEFGRSPGKGQNHYPRAWTTVLAGAGIKAAQVVGATDKSGGSVADRPISAKDFMATVCKALGIDYTKSTIARNGRPFRIVDKDARPVEALLS